MAIPGPRAARRCRAFTGIICHHSVSHTPPLSITHRILGWLFNRSPSTFYLPREAALRPAGGRRSRLAHPRPEAASLRPSVLYGLLRLAGTSCLRLQSYDGLERLARARSIATRHVMGAILAKYKLTISNFELLSHRIVSIHSPFGFHMVFTTTPQLTALDL